MSGPFRLVLLGAGGHASDVLGVVEESNASGRGYDVVGLLDDDPMASAHRFDGRGVSLLGTIDVLGSLASAWVAAIGWPTSRLRVAARGEASGLPAETLVSPKADVGALVELDAGVVVLGAARLSPRCKLGAHALVSYLSAVGHDTVVGRGTSVMPGAILSGDVHVGEGVLVGTGATVLEGRAIGDGATVGAGAVVIDDVPAGATVVGVPARVVSP